MLTPLMLAIISIKMSKTHTEVRKMGSLFAPHASCLSSSSQSRTEAAAVPLPCHPQDPRGLRGWPAQAAV